MIAKSYVSPKIEVRKSGIEGVGSFAIKPIKKGEITFIKGGYILTRDRIFSEKVIDNYFPLNDDLFLGVDNLDEAGGV